MTTSKNLSVDILGDLATFPVEEAVRRAFGTETNAPDIKVLESGRISSDASYALVQGKVPNTQDVFYAVNVSTTAPSGGIDNWLASGVFWTHHEARSYVHYLKSRGARV
jgi:hypothetical protein